MAETTSGPEQPQTPVGGAGARPVERIPVMQRILDNPFLLLFLGITVPTVFYLIWGLIEISQVPIAK